MFDCSCAAAGGETEGADCACSPIQILVFPYSGGSNVGQIANQAAVELIKKSTGKLFCLAGIGAHIQSFIETTKGAKRIVAIDGCPTACARKTLEHASFTVTDPLVVTDLGVKRFKRLSRLVCLRFLFSPTAASAALGPRSSSAGTTRPWPGSPVTSIPGWRLSGSISPTWTGQVSKLR